MMNWRDIVSIGIMVTLGIQASLAAPPRTADTQNPLLEEARQAELRGESAPRQRLLNRMLEEAPDSRDARWLLGQVEHDGTWKDYADLSDQWSEDQKLAQYRTVRRQYKMTPDDQLKLANWCRSRGLSDREQSHLTAALELSDNPNDPAIRARLGYRRVNGEWRTQTELENITQSRLDFQKNLKTWKPRVEKLAKMLASPRSSFQQQAKAELKAIQDPAALPALEIVLGQADLEAGQLLVEILGTFPSHQAADSLARLAVLSPWDAVRKEATHQLRSRPLGAYVPELLATLRTPVAARFQLLVGSSGVQLLEQFSSETQWAQQVFDRRSSEHIITRSPARRAARSSSITGRDRDRNSLARATANAALDAQLRALDSQQAVEAQQEKTEEWNQRICEVLRESTGFQLPPDPKDWWSWWADYNQMTEEEKEYQYYCYEESLVEVVELSRPPCECLVAGTPIWTDRGAVPVEAVQVGDLVLSKHPETGELKYQPVLRTTIREAEPVMKATTEHGEIRATGGHTFWVSGEGWTKLRDVKPGQHFHGATGPVELQSLEDEGTEKTYNLLVASFHTYFVGPELILSHDVTLARPVDPLIPGSVKR